MKARSRSLACLAGALAVLLLAGAMARIWRVVKLNGELPFTTFAELGTSVLSPDGNWVVYTASLDKLSTFELYASPADGSGGRVNLNRTMVNGGDVFGILVSPDSSRVVYLADQVTNDAWELFSVPIDGSSAPVKLNPAVTFFGVGSFTISPDSAWVAFQFNLSPRQLYLAPSDGHLPAVRLNPNLVQFGDVTHFQFSPDSTRVVYRADQEANERFELYSVTLAGTRVKLNAPLVSGGWVRPTFAVSPDGTRVVFLADDETKDVVELHSVPIDGSALPAELNAPLPSGGDVGQFKISAAGNGRVVFSADQDVDNQIEIYTVPIGGGLVTQLNPPIVGGVESTSFALDSDGLRVVFVADAFVAGVRKLFSAPVDGASSALLLDGSFPGLSPGSIRFVFVPGTGRVVYDTTYASTGRLYSVPLDASQAPVALDPIASPVDSPADFQISSLQEETRQRIDHSVLRPVNDPGTVFYRVDRNADGEYELCSVPADGSGWPHVVNAPLEAWGAVGSFAISTDGSRLVYSATRPLTGGFDLRALDPRAPQPPVVVCDPPATWGAVGPTSFALALEGTRAVFTVAQNYAEMTQLYSRPVDGSQPALLLDPELGSASDILLTPDGAAVVYRRTGLGPVVDQRLYVVPVDGSAPPTFLAALGPTYPQIRVSRISPDGTYVLYGEYYPDGYPPPPPSVYIVPIDGSAAPLYLTDSTVAFTADSSRVVYSHQGELYSRVVDASAPAVKLNGTLVTGGAVASWVLTGDGLRVAYRADELQDNLIELFSAPVDGSAARIPLSSGIPVASIRAAPTGGAVVFLANGQIYSVAADGSGASVRLNTDLVAGGSVASFTITPDGTRVVYPADAITDGVQELFSAEIGSSQSSVKISGPIIASGDVHPIFTISPDGTRVVYLADAITDGVQELFSAEIGNSQSSVKISGPIIASGDVLTAPSNLSPTISPDGQRVIYQADAAIDGVNELFTASITGGTAVRLHPAMAPGYQAQFAGFEPDSAHVLFSWRALIGTPTYLYRSLTDGSRPPLQIQGALGPGSGVWGEVRFGGGPTSVVVGQDVTLFTANTETAFAVDLFSTIHSPHTHAPDTGKPPRPTTRSY